MIVTSEQLPRFVADPYRPDLFCEQDFKNWDRLHDWIETSDVPVIVSGAYYDMDDYIKSRTKYGGGGFHYKFWFETEADRLSFLDRVQEIFNVRLHDRPECVYEG